jgi:phage terminase large subunit
MSAIELERPFDWKNPDYVPIFQQRQINLQKLRESPNLLKAAKVHYRNNPWDFVIDWGMTFDPRAISEGRIATLPFMMFPRQVELIKWIYESWRMGEDGLVEKSRDFGVTWVAVAFACTEWLFEPGFSAGFGSR